MAYDQGLAQRIREHLEGRDDVVEKKMFGGVAWMVQGNLACGVHKDSMILRLGPEAGEAALEEAEHTRPFDITGRPMKGWIMIDAEGYEGDEDLERWIAQGVDFALSLPAK